MKPPVYFEEIRNGAKELWDLLEAKAEVAAPWHQLFKQVQSPRHVISELLQNADDSGATSAAVQVNDNEFVFSHNGEDFESEHFASLCRFGYSNKRALHTIGFRGIGFKSTFSLGDEVRLFTPTLSVAFQKSRFTLPHWIEVGDSCQSDTKIQVEMQDVHRSIEISKNLVTWQNSPASLLFFRSLRQLTLGVRTVVWNTIGVGPVTDSEWVQLGDSDIKPVLLVRSALEEFPPECVEEIVQERMVRDGDFTMPPCNVEIVLGLDGRLYVVLPTGVRTSLPFACNGPFMQDPARVKIKDPETSPTNRWLLQRIGRLAGETMVQWLARTDLTIGERADAYGLIPPAASASEPIEAECLRIVSEAFAKAISGRPVLLTHTGQVVNQGGCIGIPAWLLRAWDEEQASVLFDQKHRPVLAREVSQSARVALVRLGCLESLSDERVLNVLKDNHLPRPKSWRELLELWAAVAPHVTKNVPNWMPSWKDVRIVPVQAHDTLYSAKEVVRLGEKRLLRTEGDWDFLSRFLLVMNPNWPRYLTEQKRNAESDHDFAMSTLLQSAERTLQAIGLSESSDATKVINQVADSFFAQPGVSNADCIRLAQISATLAVQGSPQFEFVNQSGKRTSLSRTSPLIADENCAIDLFATESWSQSHVIHSDYWSNFSSCTAEEWRTWVSTGRSGLMTFIPLRQKNLEFRGRKELTSLLQERGHNGAVTFPFVSNNFLIEDWDFADEHWRHWYKLSQTDTHIWNKLVKRVLDQPSTYWSVALSSRVMQVSTSKTRRSLDTEGLLPAWLVKLRALACLQDTWGHLRQPAELLRRTPETESLLDIEPFIRAELDTESTRPLLARLGVRDTPTGPERLLDRLKALATIENPPVFEVQKWCHRLDGMLMKCSTEEFRMVKEAFHACKLILTTDGTWAQANEVFIAASEHDVPGAAVIHDFLHQLSMWQRIGVGDRPTVDLVLRWLNNLPRNEKLGSDVLRRVREILPRYAQRIWDECGCWINLEGEWTEIANLRYSISMQSLSAWGHLFQNIKRQVADFQRLPAALATVEPFSKLPSLGSELQDQVQSHDLLNSVSLEMPWLTALGQGLSRIVTESEERTARIRKNAIRLTNTKWRTTTLLETVPYIKGIPAGTARSAEVLWDGLDLFVVDRPMTRLIRQIARELARPFDDTEIEESIKFCIDRTPGHVKEFLEQSFTLFVPVAVETNEVSRPFVSQPLLPEANIAPELGMEQNTIDPNDISSNENLENDSSSSQQEVLVSEDTDFEETLLQPEIEPNPERPTPARNPVSRPVGPLLIDTFAQLNSFKQEANGERYFHPDGRWLQKKNGQLFPWEMISADGYLAKSILIKDVCLSREPLQIPSEVWETFRRHPETHSMLVVGLDGKPREYLGSELLRMLSTGKLVLFPATYRLVCSINEAPTESSDDSTQTINQKHTA